MSNGITERSSENYLYRLLPRRDAVLAEMERYAAKHDVPIVGPAVGRMLALLVQVSGAKRIFEMGSAIGYSTIWLARAAGPGAEVFYSDGDPANARRAVASFRRAGVAPRIRVLTGDSLALLRGTAGRFDLIFIDVDKHQYPAALRIAVPKLRRGSLLITDNVLWSGRAARSAKRGDADTRGIQRFNHLVYSSKALYPVIVPLRDGVLVARKS
jgi:predicted O-methyltransferase YrrM